MKPLCRQENIKANSTLSPIAGQYFVLVYLVARVYNSNMTKATEQLKERLHKVPLKPGVYLFKDGQDRVLYVGKAKLLRQRMRSYFQNPEALQVKVRALMTHVHDFDYIVTASEMEAFILENQLIKSYQPHYNIDLRDDKTYPYLKITAETFPRAMIVRERKRPPHKYYGPFTDVGSLRTTLHMLLKAFPLRTCKSMKNRTRPCLNYDLGLCRAPCVGKITPEDYQKLVQELMAFMEGGSALTRQLENEMRAAAAASNFERAALLRDQWQSLKALEEKNQVELHQEKDLDVVGMIEGPQENLALVFQIRRGRISGKDTFWLKKPLADSREAALSFFLRDYYMQSADPPAEICVDQLPEDAALLEEWLRSRFDRRVEIKIPRRGEKKALLDMLTENARTLWEEKHQENLRQTEILKNLAQQLELEVLPRRIECYDISHLAGTETVASMVVFTDALPDNKAYRHFKIHQEQNDDFLSMRETITRRFEEAKKGNSAFLPEPDLLLIDGGLGQVNAVYMIVQEMQVDIPVRGLAKRNEEIYFPGRSTPLKLNHRDAGLLLLRHIRDEAHRFAITYNRKRRNSKLTASQLDQIPGIGPKRRQALLQHFGSVAALRRAETADIAQVEGISAQLASQIWLQLKKT
jgi:excinuclease ABC subunit C